MGHVPGGSNARKPSGTCSGRGACDWYVGAVSSNFGGETDLRD
jgi:hypothetical protein